MDMTRSTAAAAAQPAKSVLPETEVRNDVQNNHSVRNDMRNAVRHEAETQHKSAGYGMPQAASACGADLVMSPGEMAACLTGLRYEPVQDRY